METGGMTHNPRRGDEILSRGPHKPPGELAGPANGIPVPDIRFSTPTRAVANLNLVPNQHSTSSSRRTRTTPWSPGYRPTAFCGWPCRARVHHRPSSRLDTSVRRCQTQQNPSQPPTTTGNNRDTLPPPIPQPHSPHPHTTTPNPPQNQKRNNPSSAAFSSP